MFPGEPYPRKLRPKELDFLVGVLPADRPGYRHYRELINSMVVLAQGSRGPGNYVLGRPGNVPEFSIPLSPVVAFGLVETTVAAYTVTVREFDAEQIDVEIVSGSNEEVPDHIEEKKRWTYSSWLPGLPSPATGREVREVPIDENLTLAIGSHEKRIWLYDRASGMNHLLPVTNFHNELMLYKGIRDPKVALDIGLFFANHAAYSDEDLREAFVRYNAPRHRVQVQPRPPAKPAGGLAQIFRRVFGKEQQ